MEQPETAKGSKEPKESRITQQEMRAWRPVLRPGEVTALFLLLGIVLIPVGVACLAASGKVVERGKRYDDRPECVGGGENNEEREALLTQTTDGVRCNVTIAVEETMRAPVYLYYELENYYQNHRRYVKSRSDEQLQGHKLSTAAIKDCEPKLNLPGEKSKVINPCGLTAWSYFNDTYTVFHGSNTSTPRQLTVKESGIAWQTDLDHKFDSYEAENFNTIPEFRGGGRIIGNVSDDEHFIVWMRTAPMPHFRKLWGVIEQDIPKDSFVVIQIDNRYNTYRFDGRKTVVLSTTSWIGGKNDFLGIAYVTAGCVSLFCGVVFFFLHLKIKRKQGDETFLSWNRR